jgi:hypothetical protein
MAVCRLGRSLGLTTLQILALVGLLGVVATVVYHYFFG